MNGKPTFSVIIPTFNTGWALGCAIDSVLAQTVDTLEVIIIDDGSEDNTRLVVDSYADPRIRYIFQQNAGRAAARNIGIEHAQGEWLAFLDADDLWLPHKLATQQAAIEKNPSAAMVYAQAYALSERDRHTGAPHRTGLEKVLGSGRAGSSNCLHEFLSGHFDVQTSTVLARRSALAETGGFDTAFTIAEDWDLFIRLAHHGAVFFVEEPLALYWLGPFESRLDRARRYGSHRELLQIAYKNIELFGMSAREPDFAAHMLAMWEWRCAMIEHGLGNIERARQHVAGVQRHSRLFFKHADTVRLTSNYLADICGDTEDEGTFHEAARNLIVALLPGQRLQAQLLRQCLHRFHTQMAFRSYANAQPRHGLKHALHAARYDLNCLRNRGLWTKGIRLLLPL